MGKTSQERCRNLCPTERRTPEKKEIQTKMKGYAAVKYLQKDRGFHSSLKEAETKRETSPHPLNLLHGKGGHVYLTSPSRNSGRGFIVDRETRFMEEG